MRGEDILDKIPVCRHQRARRAGEAYGRAIGRNGRMGGLAKSRLAIGVARDQQQCAGEQILAENIGAEQAIPGDKIAGLRGEADIAPIGRDIGIKARGIALILPAIGRNLHDRAGPEILAVDIGHAIAVAGEHGRGGGKHHVTAIGRDSGPENALHLAGQALAIGTLRGAGDRPAQHVLHEDIVAVIAVIAGEIGGGAVKGDISAIRGDGRRVHRPGTGLYPIGGEVHPQGRRGEHVLAEDIDRIIRVIIHDIIGGAEKGDIAPIGRDCRREGYRIRRQPIGCSGDNQHRPRRHVLAENIGKAIAIIDGEVGG